MAILVVSCCNFVYAAVRLMRRDAIRSPFSALASLISGANNDLDTGRPNMTVARQERRPAAAPLTPAILPRLPRSLDLFQYETAIVGGRAVVGLDLQRAFTARLLEPSQSFQDQVAVVVDGSAWGTTTRGFVCTVLGEAAPLFSDIDVSRRDRGLRSVAHTHHPLRTA